MTRHLQAVLGLLLVGSALQVALPIGSAGAAEAPTHSVSVTGAGVSTYPAYADGIDRYAVRTTADTAGTLDVTATTTDPDGTITVNGRPATSGQPLELTGLEPGDEVAVAIDDAGGASRQAFVYLPAGFPELAASGARPADAAPYVFLGLGSFLSTTSFETAVDEHGVPVHVRETLEPHDFKPQEHGPAYTVFEPVKDSPDDQEYGYRVLELDDQFRQTGVRRFTPVDALGITADDTDFHDVEYLADGRVVLVGYHRDTRPDGTKWLDAVIEIVEPDGTLDFAWTSKGRTDPSEGYVLGAKGQDYAHINSVEMQPDGDLVASFRNLGQVMRIATTAHDGLAPGDVVWRLGGERSDFTFVDDPAGGFCAQHDARLVGDVLTVFDNGSRYDGANALGGQTADMCPDPANPDGPRIARAQSRVAEYRLDEVAHTATLIRSFQVPGRYAAFAGNAQRQADDDLLIGWSNAQSGTDAAAPITSEVTPAGDETWSLTSRGWFSYRAFAGDAPDAIAPTISGSAMPGAPATWSCQDRGGSTLQSCTADVPYGSDVPASGRVEVTATDGAGNTTRTTLPVVIVDPSSRADMSIRLPGGPWRHQQVGLALQRPGARATAYIRVRNPGQAQRLHLDAVRGNRAFVVHYVHGGTDVTRRITHGRLRTPVLEHGEAWTLRVVVRRTQRADRGDVRRFDVLGTAYGIGGPGQVTAVARAR